MTKKDKSSIKTDESKLMHKIIMDEHYRQWKIHNAVFNTQRTIFEAAKVIAENLEFSSVDNERGTHRELNKAYAKHFIDTCVIGLLNIEHEEEFYAHSFEEKEEFIENLVTIKLYIEEGYVHTKLTESDYLDTHGVAEDRKRIREELDKLAMRISDDQL